MIKLQNVKKAYHRKNADVRVFDDLNFSINEGDFYAVMGPSGTGKSTFLNLVGGVDRVDSGEYWFNGERIDGYTEGQLSEWRSHHVAFIFQSFNLLKILNAAENVELPLLLTDLPSADRKRRVMKALELVGLQDRAEHLPDELSGGQQQRVAIARAIVSDTPLILCDEPTGNIDAEATEEILEILQLLNKEFKKTIVMVTHDLHAAEYANQLFSLEKGNFEEKFAQS
ncbi:ABC transporter ATP-binding protein [Paraneptunicella aestuarii]|uniref:ABC transporter ATP-binding protein n=1 Tax=Paraneptunicella aestuarii TaxID=2831148 RepID=UPI001E5E1F90|nr:ABC transporter ATP-binding protein [Paraneptunicella aestuarii]UAA40059.1 ABC transporter ATP-binding protein [Paraneptunicella aestuarii]